MEVEKDPLEDHMAKKSPWKQMLPGEHYLKGPKEVGGVTLFFPPYYQSEFLQAKRGGLKLRNQIHLRLNCLILIWRRIINS